MIFNRRAKNKKNKKIKNKTRSTLYEFQKLFVWNCSAYALYYWLCKSAKIFNRTVLPYECSSDICSLLFLLLFFAFRVMFPKRFKSRANRNEEWGRKSNENGQKLNNKDVRYCTCWGTISRIYAFANMFLLEQCAIKNIKLITIFIENGSTLFSIAL